MYIFYCWARTVSNIYPHTYFSHPEVAVHSHVGYNCSLVRTYACDLIHMYAFARSDLHTCTRTYSLSLSHTHGYFYSYTSVCTCTFTHASSPPHSLFPHTYMYRHAHMWHSFWKRNLFISVSITHSVVFIRPFALLIWLCIKEWMWICKGAGRVSTEIVIYSILIVDILYRFSFL